VLMGVFKLGKLIKYIPRSVTIGFTSGIAVIIFSGQIGDFLGLEDLEKKQFFHENMIQIAQNLSSVNWYSVLTAIIGLASIILIRLNVTNRSRRAILSRENSDNWLNVWWHPSVVTEFSIPGNYMGKNTPFMATRFCNCDARRNRVIIISGRFGWNDRYTPQCQPRISRSRTCQHRYTDVWWNPSNRSHCPNRY